VILMSLTAASDAEAGALSAALSASFFLETVAGPNANNQNYLKVEPF